MLAFFYFFFLLQLSFVVWFQIGESTFFLFLAPNDLIDLWVTRIVLNDYNGPFETLYGQPRMTSEATEVNYFKGTWGIASLIEIDTCYGIFSSHFWPLVYTYDNS